MAISSKKTEEEIIAVGGGGGTDDQTASEVPVTPSGNLTSTNVQAALQELQTDIDSAGSGTTNLGTANVNANTVDITSSTGTDTTIPAATTSTAGLISATDKSKLDNVETNATADQTALEVPFTATGNTTSTNVQSAIEEIQTELDGVSGGGGSAIELEDNGTSLSTDVKKLNFTNFTITEPVADEFEITAPAGGSGSTLFLQPLIDVYLNTNSLSTVSGFTDIILDGETENTAGLYNTANGTFTVPETKKYLVKYQVSLENVTSGRYRVVLRDATDTQVILAEINGNQFSTIHGDRYLELDSTKTYNLELFSSVASQNVTAGDEWATFLQVFETTADASGSSGSSTITGIVASGTFTDDGTTVTILDNNNIDTVVRENDGQWLVTFTEALANATYPCGADASTISGGGINYSHGAEPVSTTQMRIYREAANGNALPMAATQQMSFWAYGEVSVAGGSSGGSGALEFVEEIVATGGENSLTFSGLSGDNYFINFAVDTDTSGFSKMYINGDTTDTNYRTNRIFSATTTPSGSAADNSEVMFVNAGENGVAGSIEIIRTPTNSTFFLSNTAYQNSTNTSSGQYAGRHEVTTDTDITEIRFDASGTFEAGSRFTLYRYSNTPNSGGGGTSTPNRINYTTNDEVVIPNRYFETSSGMYKPMYRKVIDLGSLPNSVNGSVAHGLNTADIELGSLSQYGEAHNSGNTTLLVLPYTDVNNISNGIGIFITGTNIEIRLNTDRSNLTGSYTLEYAKVSDTEVTL